MNMYWIFVDVVLVVIIIFGNVMTIVARRLNNKPNQKLISVTSSKLLLSLAISDSCVGFAVLYDLAFCFTPFLSDHKFSYVLRLVFLCGACTASFFNVAAVAVNRYIAIEYAIEYTTYVTKKLVNYVIVVNWCGALLMSTIPFYWNEYQSPSTKKCELLDVFPNYYVNVILVPIFLTVWVSIIVLYWKIWKKSRVQFQEMKDRLKTNNPDSNRVYSKRDQVVLSILSCFTACWLPYVVVSFIQFLEPLYEPDSMVRWMVYWIAMLNSGINPLIYAWNNPSFSKGFRNSIKRKSQLAKNKHDLNNCQAVKQQPAETFALTKGDNKLICDVV